MEINHHSYHIFKHKQYLGFMPVLGEAAGCSTHIWQSFTRTVLVSDWKNTISKSAEVPAAVVIWKALKWSAWEVKPEAISITHPAREASSVLGCQQERSSRIQSTGGEVVPLLLGYSKSPMHLCLEQMVLWYTPASHSPVGSLPFAWVGAGLGLSACTVTRGSRRDNSLDFTTDQFKIIKSSFKIGKQGLTQRHHVSRLWKQIYLCCLVSSKLSHQIVDVSEDNRTSLFWANQPFLQWPDCVGG